MTRTERLRRLAVDLRWLNEEFKTSPHVVMNRSNINSTALAVELLADHRERCDADNYKGT